MKIDRLLGITMYLLNRDKVSAKTLADRFEVSVRTIQRDIESLNMAGIPVSSQTGGGGGYEILDSFRLNKQIMNTEDYLFVITALKGLCSAIDNRNLNTTLEKVLAVNKAKNQNIHLDFSVLKENKSGKYIDLLEQSIREKTVVELEYTNADNKISTRVVEPLAIIYKWYSWYLFAFCCEKNDYRLFKLIRIENIKTVKTQFITNHLNINHLIEKHLSSSNQEFYDTKILCKSFVRMQVLEYLGNNIVKEFENGDFILSVRSVKNERMWFSLLMGFGSDVTVLEPQELKEKLFQKAKEIKNIYDIQLS